jgi:hypothetical protein
MKEASYIEGFLNKCAQYEVSPDVLTGLTSLVKEAARGDMTKKLVDQFDELLAAGYKPANIDKARRYILAEKAIPSRSSRASFDDAVELAFGPIGGPEAAKELGNHPHIMTQEMADAFRNLRRTVKAAPSLDELAAKRTADRKDMLKRIALISSPLWGGATVGGAYKGIKNLQGDNDQSPEGVKNAEAFIKKAQAGGMTKQAFLGGLGRMIKTWAAKGGSKIGTRLAKGRAADSTRKFLGDSLARYSDDALTNIGKRTKALGMEQQALQGLKATRQGQTGLVADTLDKAIAGRKNVMSDIQRVGLPISDRMAGGLGMAGLGVAGLGAYDAMTPDAPQEPGGMLPGGPAGMAGMMGPQQSAMPFYGGQGFDASAFQPSRPSYRPPTFSSMTQPYGGATRPNIYTGR